MHTQPHHEDTGLLAAVLLDVVLRDERVLTEDEALLLFRLCLTDTPVGAKQMARQALRLDTTFERLIEAPFLELEGVISGGLADA